uniref:Uncharacterized protein n=1 Tax=Plectus sambesii TaxID=2011161 RepID=A0A914UWT8_9BILA
MARNIYSARASAAAVLIILDLRPHDLNVEEGRLLRGHSGSNIEAQRALIAQPVGGSGKRRLSFGAARQTNSISYSSVDRPGREDTAAAVRRHHCHPIVSVAAAPTNRNSEPRRLPPPFIATHSGSQKTVLMK